MEITRALALSVLLLTTPGVFAEPVEMVVLVDKTSNQSEELSKYREAFVRESVAEVSSCVARKVKELSEKGYITATVEDIARGDLLARLATGKSVSAIGNLGFVPLDFSGSEFDRAELLGVAGYHSRDGSVHRLIYRFSHPELGQVVLDESSFLTDTDTVRLVVSKPLGNIWINGQPGTAFALSTPDGTKGKTVVRYHTNSKRFSLSVGRSIPVGTEEFAAVERLAQALR